MLTERRFVRPLLLCASCLFIISASAQTEAPTYRMPPQAIADLVDAPLTPAMRVDPTKTWMLVLNRRSLPSIAELSRPELRIAGIRINPANNDRSRASLYTNLTLKHLTNGTEKRIVRLPGSGDIGNVYWSPDGAHIGFTMSHPDRMELWVAEVVSGYAWKIMDNALNGAYGRPFFWLPDSRAIMARTIPSNRRAAPEAPTVPTGPVIQENVGGPAPARTYQDLLQDPHDEALFEHFLTSQVMQVGLDGSTKMIGGPGLIRHAEPSPDGKYILAETIHRPYSYTVPIYRFPVKVDLWDATGMVVKNVTDMPLADNLPIGFGAVTTGPRSFGWRSDAPATLYWIEAQDGGDPKVKADIRDIVYMHSAPFSSAPVALTYLGLRYSSVRWGHDELALVTSREWQTRRTRTWAVKPGKPDEEAVLLFDRLYEDRYSDPGTPVTQANSQGRPVLVTDMKNTRKIYLFGTGASPEGDRPFVDELDTGINETERLWRANAPFYESPVHIVDVKQQRVITSRESKNEPANFYIRDLKKNTTQTLTRFPHPYPMLANVRKELLKYKRADGVNLTATLYLPPGYNDSDGPVPMLMWAYPREFKTAAAAAQVIGSPHRFVRISSGSPLFWLAHGYAVLSNPTMPIIGEGEVQPNDTYVAQLVSSAQAAIDAVVTRGVADRGRIAIGGHSYGAFMTANLLAHSDLYRAGIARSGAFNRTLTPFGFQSEERTYWEAPEVYFAMSPFMHAHKVNEPILLIHGEADNNSGTFPIQSRRFYHALKGHGAPVRLVMLPHESHGYRGRESVMHMLWEMTQWLDTYVKNAKPTKVQ